MSRAFKIYIEAHYRKLRRYNAEKPIAERVCRSYGALAFCAVLGFFSLLAAIGLGLDAKPGQSLMATAIFAACAANFIYAHYRSWREQVLNDKRKD